MMIRTSVIVFVLGGMIGCGESDEIRQYKVAKDKAAAVDPHAGHDHGPGEGHEHEESVETAKPQAAPFATGGQGAPLADPDSLGPVIDQSPADLPITYAVPPGWREHAPKNSFRTAEFSAGPPDAPAITTISMAGGDNLANINRWRGQVGLEPISAQELEKQAQKIEVDGIEAYYVDLDGPAGEGKPAQRIAGVIIPRGERAWFIKMVGLSGLVGQEKERFEALTRSIKFK